MIGIGECIHIISQSVKNAVENRDKAFIQDLAKRQADKGAAYLDLNIGPQKKTGAEVMPWMVETIQEVTDLPLSLDTTNAVAIEAGLKVCKNKDGCCAEGCNGNTDTDCEPVCGNDVCEPGETSDTCYDDCGPVCGNNKCESGETANSCPADCYQPVCGNRNCETGEDYNSCSYDCCEPEKWYQDGSTCNCPGGYNRETDWGGYP